MLHCVVALSGCIVKHWSPLLATSKAQQLLFRIVDGLLLPHSLAQQQDKALRESLPLYLQVRAVSTLARQHNAKESGGVGSRRRVVPPAGSVGGLQRVSVSGGLPEAAAPLGGPQVPGSLPAPLALAGRHRQPPGAPECL